VLLAIPQTLVGNRQSLITMGNIFPFIRERTSKHGTIVPIATSIQAIMRNSPVSNVMAKPKPTTTTVKLTDTATTAWRVMNAIRTEEVDGKNREYTTIGIFFLWTTRIGTGRNC
jgi:hypothetical protein